MRSVLDLAGASVVATTSAESDRAAVATDVIVCDLASPKVAGAFLTELRARLAPLGQAVPAIGLAPAGSRNAGVWSPGFERYLSKPVDGAELRTAIVELVRASPLSVRIAPVAGNAKVVACGPAR